MSAQDAVDNIRSKQGVAKSISPSFHADQLQMIIDDKSAIQEAFGWAQYADGQYTSESPLVVNVGNTVQLTNNANTTIKAQLPEGVTDFYDASTNTLTPDTLGDGYLLRINMKAYTTSNTGYGEIYVDIGNGTPIKIIELSVNFPRGTGANNVRPYTSTSFVYALDTLIANGGKVYYESVRGTTSIYDIVFIIERTSKGK